MINLLAVGIGGFLGAIGRFLLSEWIPATGAFPLATLFINWIGCLLLAFILTSVCLMWYPKIKLAVTTGFCGAFTTFSTFSLESLHLLLEGAYIQAVVYILLNVFGGIALSILGFVLAKGGRTL